MKLYIQVSIMMPGTRGWGEIGQVLELPEAFIRDPCANVSQSVITRIQTRDDRARREISGSCCPMQTSSKFKLVRFIRQKSFPALMRPNY